MCILRTEHVQLRPQAVRSQLRGQCYLMRVPEEEGFTEVESKEGRPDERPCPALKSRPRVP